MLFKAIQNMYDNPPTKWVGMSGIYPEILEERHAKLVLPLKDLHLNHVNIAYAGSMFIAMELGAATLFSCTYGVDKWIPILKRIEIDFVRPTKKDLVADLRMTEEDAKAKLDAVKEKGKGDMFIDVVLCDIDGVEVAKANVNFFVVPFTDNFIKK